MDDTGWRTASQNRRCFQNSAKGVAESWKGVLTHFRRAEMRLTRLDGQFCLLICVSSQICLTVCQIRFLLPGSMLTAAHSTRSGNGTFQSILMAQEGSGSSSVAEDHQSRLGAVRRQEDHECRNQRRSEQPSRLHNHQQPLTRPVLSAIVLVLSADSLTYKG